MPTESGLRTWSPAIVWAGVIFVLSSVPGTAYPNPNIPGADKIVHMALYGVLGFFSVRALQPHLHARPRLMVLLGALIAGLFGITDELHQLFVPHRSCDWRDAVADVIGGALGAAALVRFVRWRTRRDN